MDAQIKILEVSFEKKNALIKEKMMVIPNIIDESVPIGKMIVKMLRFKDLERFISQVLRYLIMLILLQCIMD